MEQTYESQGKTFKMALANAQNIKYSFTQQDSLITLSPRLQLKSASIWRNQEVFVAIKVPVGTRLYINEDVSRHLQFNYYSCAENHSDTKTYREWVMTENGLKCTSILETKEE